MVGVDLLTLFQILKGRGELEGAMLAMIGLAAGLLGGLLGIGGSIVMIPAMTELLGPKQHVYQAAALMVAFFVATPAVVQHLRAKAVDLWFLRRLIPSAVVAAVTGVVCSELPLFRGKGSIYLTGLFGLFLFFIAIRDLIGLVSRRRSLDDPRHGVGDSSGEHSRIESAETGWVPVAKRATGWGVVWLVGVPTGFISGLLGVGGGVLAVPLQRRLCGVPMPRAIGNSAATIVALSLVGASLKNYALAVNHPDLSWHQPMELALFLIPTAMIGAWVGARLTHVLPLRIVRAAFMILLVVAGLRMVCRTFS